MEHNILKPRGKIQMRNETLFFVHTVFRCCGIPIVKSIKNFKECVRIFYNI